MLEVALRHAFPGPPGGGGTGFALDLAFAAPVPGVVALFGPSGGGKSSVLAAVAGLLRPQAGRVALDGATLTDTAARVFVAPERRRCGVVFQEARLFPHLSVETNLRYGLRRAPRDAAGPGFEEVVGLLGIGHLLRRRPAGLSGGERQRVALGRALLSRPRLLLMDEPLAALDAPRRAEVLPFLERLHAEARLPILYVTHALEEVDRLADTLVLIEAGRAVAAGPVEALMSVTAGPDFPSWPGLTRPSGRDGRVKPGHDVEEAARSKELAEPIGRIPYHAIGSRTPSRPARSCTHCHATRPERAPRVTDHSFAAARNASPSIGRPKARA